MISAHGTSLINMTNGSVDSFADGCFKNFNKFACSRDALEAILALMTAIFCLVKIVKLHLARHELWKQYMIFYSAIVEIILLTINWMYVHQAAIDLIAELLKLFQFLVVCRFYCEIASRMSKKENMYKRFFLPSLLLTFTYFVILIIVGIIRMRENVDECVEPEWLQLSCSEVALGIVFIAVGVYITRQTNKLKTDGLYKRNVRLSLWGIILSFELSAVVSMVYDISMIFIGKDNHCKGIFLTSPVAFTICHVFVKIIKWLLPIWAMMLIFKPESFEGGTVEEDADQPPIVQQSSTGIFTSEFRPRGKSFNYKHLRNPDNESERNLIAPDPTGDYPTIKVKKKRRKKRGDRTRSENSSTGDTSSTSPSSPQKQNRTRTSEVDVSVSINPGSSGCVAVKPEV